MAAFAIASALLVLLLLAFVLRPIWRARPAAGIGVLATLAITTGLLYTLVGTPRALDPAQRKAPETLSEAITQLRTELQRDPNQTEGWRLLARAYDAESRLPEARDAYARAVQLAPDEPALLAEAAEARAKAAEGRRFDAEAIDMLQHALQIEPDHQRARWFLGIAQRQAGQPAEAVTTWEPLLGQVDASTAASLRQQINLAREDAGMEPLPATLAAVASAARITVSVSLDPALAMQYPDNAVVFVIARQPDGPPMPVAVEKLRASGFPLKVTLDDGDSPMPTLKLSQVEQVELVARISASGDAAARPGDFESAPVRIETGPDAAAALMIDRVIE
ncbi:MAG: tetratricopeptide repeat protein [Lysobacter sp.]